VADDNKPDALDPAAQVAEDLRAQLKRMTGDELLEMAVQLVTTYVVEGVPPLARAQNEAALPQDTVGDETFAGLLRRLKAERRNDPVLDRFHVDGENISVRLEGFGLVPLTEYRRSAVPPSAGGAAPARSVPTPRDSIYNRGLYEQQPTGDLSRPVLARQQPAQPAPAAATAPRGAAPAAPAPAAQPARAGQPAQQQDKQQQGPSSDRFKLIELD
jgi:hypothetical protein